MRKYSLLLVCLVCALGTSSQAGDVLQSSFTGVVDDICAATTRPSTVLCVDGTLEPSTGAMLDMSGENLIQESEDFGTWWVTARASVIPNVRKAPDGTWTGDVLREDATAASTHYIRAPSVITSGNTYAVTVWAQPVNRNTIGLVFEGGSRWASFRMIGDGAVIGSAGATASIIPDRGWYKLSIEATATVSGNVYINISGIPPFDGLDQDSLAIWGAQVYQRTGQWANKRSPYIRTAAVAKPRHDLAQSPVTPTKSVDLDYQVSGKLDWTALGITAPTFEVDFSQDPSGATITANTGQVLTKAGTPDRVTDGTWPLTLAGAEGQAHSFDGAADYYTSTIGPPAGDFSVACVINPYMLPAQSVVIGNYTSTGNLRGWRVSTMSQKINFFVSDDGTSAAGHITSLERAGTSDMYKSNVFVATYEYVGVGAVNKMYLYVDELSTVSTATAYGPVFAGSCNMSIGAECDGLNKYTGLIQHCAVIDGVALTETQARNIIRTWRGLLGPDGTTSIASATSPNVQLVDPTTSTTRPFIVPMPANTTQVGVKGIYTQSAITNLMTEPGFEAWGADGGCGRCPTGTGCSCPAGDGTSAIVEEATDRAEKAYSAKMSITGTTSEVYINSACLTTGIGADIYGDMWAKSVGASNFRFRIREFDDAACVTTLQYSTFYSGAVPAAWTRIQGKVAAASWHADTSSYKIQLVELGDGGVDTYVDAVQVRASSVPVSGFCAGTCNHVIPSYPSMLTANGESEIEITAQSPWAGTDLVLAMFLWAENVTSTNSWTVSILSGTDEPSCTIVDSAGNPKYNTPNVANWAANTEYTVKTGFTGTGPLRIWWNDTWYTTTTGTGTGTRSAPHALSYIGASSVSGGDFWIKHVRMTTRGAPYGTNDVALQRNDGNKSSGAKFMGYNYFTKASHDSMNVFDQDHTVTVVAESVTNAVVPFNKGNSGGGMWLVHGSPKVARYYTPQVDVPGPTAPAVYAVGVVQEVRSANMSQLYDNGVSGVATDVTGVGDDTGIGLYIGAYSTGASAYIRPISYVRLDSEALSASELARERQMLQGWGTNRKNQAWTFARSTIGTGKFGNLSLATVAANVPRLGGPGGGVLIENQATQLLRYSQAFGSWASVNRMSVVADYANDYLAPDGTRTAQVFAEDGTAANSHYVRDSGKALSIGTDYTFSVYIRPVNRHHVGLAVDGSVSGASFDVSGSGRVGTLMSATGGIEPSTNGFFRIWMTFTSGVASQATYIYIQEADNDPVFDGLSQDSLVVWGAQLEAGKVPTSYIYSGASANVVRVSDGMSMSAVTAGLPAMICPTCAAKKLKMSVEIKCTNRLPSTPAVQSYIVTLGGSASANNQAQLYLSATGRYYFSFTDSVGTAHSVYSTIDMATCNDWVKLEGSFDTSDLTSLAFTVNGSNTGMTYTGNAGTAIMDMAGLNVNFGNRAGGVVSNCWHRNLRITVE